MGRHAAPAKPPSGRRGQDLAAWGAFTVPMAVLALGLAGTGWLAALAVGALGTVAFVVVWLAARRVPGTEPAAPDEPAVAGDGASSRPAP